jgi:hypothetical protein
VKKIFGLSSGVQSFTMEEKQKGTGIQTKIAHHSLQYFWGKNENEEDTMAQNVVMKIQGDEAFKGAIWRNSNVEYLHDTDREQKQPTVTVTLTHATNVTVHALPEPCTEILTGVVERNIGPIPLREGQKFGDLTMEPFAPSTHTLLRAKFTTLEDKSVALDNVNFNETGLLLLVKGLLNPKTEETDKKTLIDLQKNLASGMMEELRGNKALKLEKDKELLVRFDAEYCHSLFDTTVRIRPAPHTEISLGGLQQLQEGDQIFVKYFVLPVGVCPEGLWLRIFKDNRDLTGCLIKLEPDSILGYPATAIRETGRISHIEGNPHFMLRIAVSADDIRGLEDCDPDLWDHRSYPHLVDTVKKYMDESPEEWEKAFRTVGIHPAGYIKEVQGLTPQHLEAFKDLCSQESAIFNMKFEI